MAVELNWVGGEHPFHLRIGELRRLDDACKDGVYAAFGRMGAMQPRVDDVLETIRLGLIGGGMDKDEAAKLTRKAEEQYGVGDLIVTARTVLFMAFHRREETGSGKTETAPES